MFRTCPNTDFRTPPKVSRHKWLRLTALSILFCSYSTLSQADKLKVAVAANFHQTLESLARKFEEKHPPHTIEMVTGSSSDLSAQVASPDNGFDLFLSADSLQPELLEKEGQIQKGTRKTYAFGKLVFWHQQKTEVAPEDIGSYLKNQRPTVAIADPENAPYGNRSVEVLESLNVYNMLKNNGRILVSDHVHEAWESVDDGNAMTGLIAGSLLIHTSEEHPAETHEHPYPENIETTGVPEDLYTPLEQQMVIMSDTGNPELAETFSDFLLSDESQEYIASHGYFPIPPVSAAVNDQRVSTGTLVSSVSSVALVTILAVGGWAYCRSGQQKTDRQPLTQGNEQ